MTTKGFVPVSLEIWNGLTYEHVLIPLEDQGLVFVRGVNHDTTQRRSNGSGKSSFGDVLEHILFESTSRGLDKDEVIRAGAPDGYLAKLKLKTPEGVLLIEQSRKHSSCGTSLRIRQQFSHGWEEISPPKNIPKTKAMLASLLGMTKQQFHGSVYVSQAAGHPLVTGTGTEVAKYLSASFGYDLYDNLRQGVKDITDGLQLRVSQAEAHRETLKELDLKLAEFDDADYTLTMAPALLDYVEFGQEQLLNLQDRRAELASLRSRAQRKQDLLSELGPDSGSDPAAIEVLLVKRRRLADNLQGQSGELKAQKALLESQKSTRARLQQLTKELSVLGPSSDTLDTLGQRVQSLRSALASSRPMTNTASELVGALGDILGQLDPGFSYGPESVAGWQADIASFKAQNKALAAASAYAASLGDDPECPTCGQLITEEHRQEELAKAQSAQTLYERLEARRSEAEGALKLVAQITALEPRLVKFLAGVGLQQSEDLRSRSDAIKQFLSTQDIPKMESELRGLEKRLRLMTEVSQLETVLATADDTQDSTEDPDTQIAALKLKEETIRKEVARLETTQRLLKELLKLEDSPSLESVNSAEAALQAEISSLRADLRATQLISSKFQADSTLLKELLDRQLKANSFLKQFAEDFQNLERLKQLQKALVTLKTRKLHGVVQSVRDLLPAYINLMFDGEDIQFELDDADPESILLLATRPSSLRKGERDPIPVRGLSKGERAGLRASLLWTLKDIQQPAKSVDLLILDEADDGLDEAGLAAFCALLEQIRTQYGTVIVVSQRQELTGVKFDQVWTATKRGGITTMQMN